LLEMVNHHVSNEEEKIWQNLMMTTQQFTRIMPI
jgi:hypothetical protein